jgi:hypothetical protein
LINRRDRFNSNSMYLNYSRIKSYPSRQLNRDLIEYEWSGFPRYRVRFPLGFDPKPNNFAKILFFPNS